MTALCLSPNEGRSWISVCPLLRGRAAAGCPRRAVQTPRAQPRAAQPSHPPGHAGARLFGAPGSWLAQLPGAAHVAAGYELLYRLGKSYEKPTFDIPSVRCAASRSPVVEQTALAKPFCRLQRFDRHSDRPDVAAALAADPVVLVVAPLSGHHATLLRDTVRTMLGDHTVYITDWIDARMVPAAAGAFTLADYVGYLREFIRHIGAERLHIVSICQGAVPGAGCGRAARRPPASPQPRSLVMMGGPIDTRRNPTRVNAFATSKRLSWFEANVIHDVPAQYPGRGRRVYPGFLQHAGFIAMNPVRHMSSHWEFFEHLAARQRAARRRAPRLLRRIQRRARHAGRVLPGLHPHRVPAAPAAARAVAGRRRTRRARGDHPHRAADRRGREGRHLGPRPDRGGASRSAPASPPSESAT